MRVSSSGRLDVGDQPPLEPGAHPVFQGLQPFRWSVRGHHDLLVRVVQRVEGVEELLLGSFLALQELDVVDEQDVDVAVAPLERDLAVVPQAVDEVVGELLGGDVAHPHPGEQPLGVVPDGVQQMRLAQPGVTPDEQRVVGPRRRLGDRDRGRVREPVGRADDERVERVPLVQPGVRTRGDRLRRPRRGVGRPDVPGRRTVQRRPLLRRRRGVLGGQTGVAGETSEALGPLLGPLGLRLAVRLGIDDDGQRDRGAKVAPQRVADRLSQVALDVVLGEVGRCRQQCGAVAAGRVAGSGGGRRAAGRTARPSPQRPQPPAPQRRMVRSARWPWGWTGRRRPVARLPGDPLGGRPPVEHPLRLAAWTADREMISSPQTYPQTVGDTGRSEGSDTRKVTPQTASDRCVPRSRLAGRQHANNSTGLPQGVDGGKDGDVGVSGGTGVQLGDDPRSRRIRPALRESALVVPGPTAEPRVADPVRELACTLEASRARRGPVFAAMISTATGCDERHSTN